MSELGSFFNIQRWRVGSEPATSPLQEIKSVQIETQFAPESSKLPIVTSLLKDYCKTLKLDPPKMALTTFAQDFSTYLDRVGNNKTAVTFLKHEYVREGIKGALERQFDPQYNEKVDKNGVKRPDIRNFFEAVDPEKVNKALSITEFVYQIGEKHAFNVQFLSTLNLVAFVADEYLEKKQVNFSNSEQTIQQLTDLKENEKLKGKRSIARHLVQAVHNLPKDSAKLDKKALLSQLVVDTHGRLEQWTDLLKILDQPQGVEVEILKKMTQSKPAEERGVDVARWLPRGITKEVVARNDWFLLPLLGQEEDVGERLYQIFEISTTPTETVAPQNTILQALIAGDFIDERFLSKEKEYFSMHMSTVFPEKIWTEKAKTEYYGLSRVLSGAFASMQRIQYGGFAAGRTTSSSGEIKRNNKTKTKSIVREKLGKGEVTTTKILGNDSYDAVLAEIRSLDVNADGHYSAGHLKALLDFGFKSYWSIETQYNKNPSSLTLRSSEIWTQFNHERVSLFASLGITENQSNGWKALADAVDKNLNLQKKFAELARKHGYAIRRLAEGHQRVIEAETHSRFSPTIGLLTTAERSYDKGRLVVGKHRERILKKTIQAAGKNGVRAVVINEHSIDLDKGTCLGFTLNERGEWIEVETNIPDAIHSYGALTPKKLQIQQFFNNGQRNIPFISERELAMTLLNARSKQKERSAFVERSPQKLLAVEPLAKSDNCIYLSKQERQQRGVEVGDILDLSFGAWKQKVKILAAKSLRVKPENTNEEKSKIRISSNLAKKLPTDSNLRVLINSERREIKIGSTFGIMSKITEKNGQPQMAQSQFFKNIIRQASQEGVYSYVFDPGNVNLENKEIQAWTYDNRTNKWQKKNLPLPAVVFDRSFLNVGSELEWGNQVRRYFNDSREIALMNSIHISEIAKDKQQFFDSLSINASLRNSLPDTTILTSEEPEIFKQHQLLYLKPKSGSMGRGVIQIRKTAEGFIYQYKPKNQELLIGKAKTYSDLLQMTTEIRGSEDYILQQGIESAKVDGRLFDVRTCLQKDKYGKWQFIGMGARIGESQAVTSNISTGGRVAFVEEVISQFGNKAVQDQIRKDIEKTALLVVEELDKFGESADLSVDFILDEQGKPYIVEVNNKAGQLFGDLDDQETNQKRTRVLIDRVIGLADFDRSPKKSSEEITVVKPTERLLLEPLGKEPDRIYLSKKIQQKLGVVYGDSIRMKVGKKEQQLKVVQSKLSRTEEESTWRVSRNVLTDVQLPDYVTMHSKWDKQGKELTIGPFLGILARQDQFGDGVSGEPFGDSTQELYDVIRYSVKKGGVIYVFSPESVDFDKKTVKAYMPESVDQPDHTKVKWKELELPLPDIYWSRHFSHNSIQRQKSQETKEKLRRVAEIKPLNSMQIGNIIGVKDRFAEFLRDDSDLNRFTPETKKLSQLQDLEIFLQKHESVYVKPASGTKGRGIVKCWKVEDKYSFSREENGRVIESQVNSISELVNQAGINWQLTRYICQQGINLARLNGNLFDVRILAQKADGINWQSTGMGARVSASPDAITSNLHTGGKAQKVYTVLNQLFPQEKVQSILTELERISQLLPIKLDQKTNQETFELGIDVAIDKNGKVWILEANPMPGKAIFLDTDEPGKREKACSAVMSHAIQRLGYA